MQDTARKVLNILCTLQSALPRHGTTKLTALVLTDLEKVVENLIHCRKACEATFRYHIADAIQYLNSSAGSGFDVQDVQAMKSISKERSGVLRGNAIPAAHDLLKRPIAAPRNSYGNNGKFPRFSNGPAPGRNTSGRCNYCQEQGHFKRDCLKLKSRNNAK